MDSRAACPDCGGLNRPDAPFCGRCYRRLDGARPQDRGPVPLAQAISQPPGGPVPNVRGGSSYRYLPPAMPMRPAYASASYAPPSAFESALSTGTLARGSYVIDDGRQPVRWRWRHLWLVGAFAWGVPAGLNALVEEKLSFTKLLDASLLIQIFGYLLAVGVVALLVKTVQKGDWSTLGIQFSELSYRDLGRGALFGLILVAIWLPIGFGFSKLLGAPMFDQLIRTLVGDTSSGGLLLAAVVVVAGAPVIEEIYYRGILYTKLARRNIWVAIVVSSLLFVSAHGGLLIPPLLLMAFALGLKRRTETLWYTIGAHAAWNAVVICLAVYMLLGPAKLFTAPDHSYRLRHSADWQRVARLEQTFPIGTVDLALEGAAGSGIVVYRFELPVLASDAMMAGLLSAMLPPPAPGVPPAQPAPSSKYVEGASHVYEVTANITARGVSGESHLLAIAPRDGGQAIVLNLICPEAACVKATGDFDRTVRSIRLR